MFKIYKKIFINLSILTIFLIPSFVFSQGGASGLTYECFSGGVYGNCTFADLVAAVQNFTNRLTVLVLAFTVVPIAWAGALYMVSGGNAGNRTKANEMLKKVAIGIFFMLAAWLIVNLIASTLLSSTVPRVI